jgi:hypothetical protein
MPFQLTVEKLVVQRDHLAVALDEMVVVALDQDAAAYVERAGLARDVRPAFVDRH